MNPQTQTGRPCGHLFAGGLLCNAPEAYGIHHGQWRGPEPDHDYVPQERRSGQDRRSAEARDATGLLQWQHAIAGCRCPERPNCLPHASDGVHQWLDLCDLPHEHTDAPADRTIAAFRQRDRAALAMPPLEPRWPSRDETPVDVVGHALYEVLGHLYPHLSDAEDDASECIARIIRKREAALREGGERA